jgi:hypothetical protein
VVFREIGIFTPALGHDRFAMTRRFFSLLAASVAPLVLSGCLSTQEPAGTAAVTKDPPPTVEAVADPEEPEESSTIGYHLQTKMGVVDMIEVLKKTSIGQPALARWRREVAEAEQRKEQHLTQFYQSKKYNQHWENPWETARRNAINSIMPTVETVTKIVAEKYGFGIVMTKGNPEMVMTTFYSVDAVDLTDRVIEELNQRFP